MAKKRTEKTTDITTDTTTDITTDTTKEFQQYFIENPTSERKPLFINYSKNDFDFSFKTDSGMFSKNRIDSGSEILLDAFIGDISDAADLTGKNVLDLGCGYGFIGVVVKKIFPGFHVTMVDINSRAVEYAEINAGNNLKDEVSIIQSDGFDKTEGKFDFILLNPPIRAGKSLCYRLYEDAQDNLSDGGSLYIVIRTKQGAASTFEKLNLIYGNCKTISRKSGYKVLKSIKCE